MSKRKSLSSLVDESLRDALENRNALGADGKPVMSPTQLTQLIVAGVKWYAVKNKIGPAYGGALGGGDDG